MEKFVKKNGVSVRAYKGDAMTLLCFDLDKKRLPDFTGFTIMVSPPGRWAYYLYNRISYSPEILKASKLNPDKVNIYNMKHAPLQRFSWVHVAANDQGINSHFYGNYKYEITPRYLVNDVLLPMDKNLTVTIEIDVSPYQTGNFQAAFTRGFMESQAFTRHFGLNNKIRPDKTNLLFDITQTAGPTAKDKRRNPDLKPYTYEDMHRWLGWQARTALFDLLDETMSHAKWSLDVFAYDLNEPEICSRLLELAKQGRVRIILDDSASHTGDKAFETKFDEAFKEVAKDKNALVRGKFLALNHSKVFIQKLYGKPVKVLTGSTNFTTNGLYVNANHVLIFRYGKIAQFFADVFADCFGVDDADTVKRMKAFKKGTIQEQLFEVVRAGGVPDVGVRFSPHSKAVATAFFDKISQRILNAQSDVLFAVMNDRSQSSILDALQQQVRSEAIFTYGITDVIKDKENGVMLYKPNNKKGIMVAGKPGDYVLPEPFEEESKIPGINIHHKFVVVDFKGKDPVVYCGSSNLAFGPEQKNGDNLIEIRNRNVAAVFAIEAMRLIDHFEWRNALAIRGTKKPVAAGAETPANTFFLRGSRDAGWVDEYFNQEDLRCKTKELLIRPSRNK